MSTKTFLLTILGIVIVGSIASLVLKKETVPVVPVTETVPIEETEQPEALSLKVFFPNSIKDPGFMDCRVVHPIERTVPYTVATADAALTELIKGLTGDDIAQGFQTQIDPQATVRSLSIIDGTARVDFSKELNNKNVGLCAGQFIDAQIRQTLLQFPTVNDVVISIEGDTEFVQP